GDVGAVPLPPHGCALVFTDLPVDLVHHEIDRRVHVLGLFTRRVAPSARDDGDVDMLVVTVRGARHLRVEGRPQILLQLGHLFRSVRLDPIRRLDVTEREVDAHQVSLGFLQRALQRCRQAMYVSLRNNLQKYFFLFDELRIPSISRYLATVRLAMSMSCCASSSTSFWSE